MGRLDETKAEDMRAQHRGMSHDEWSHDPRSHHPKSHGTTRAVAIVTDNSADLDDALLDRHHIAMVRAHSGMLLTMDHFDNLLRSGRVSRGKASLGGMLDVTPILTLDHSGRAVPVDRVRGRDQVLARIFALLAQRLVPKPAAVRFGVAHADAPEVAERVRSMLVRTFRPHDCFVGLATGVLGAHVGPGAWAVFHQIEDPASA